MSTQVTVSTPRDREIFTYDDDHTVVVCRVRDLLTIELFPYWPRKDVHLSWVSSDPQVEAVLYGFAIAWGLIEGPTSYYE